MSGRVAVVDEETLAGGLERAADLRFALSPALESALEVCEGQAGVGASEGGVETHRHPEEMLGLVVVGPGETVHVPEAAVVRLPGVQRVRVV